MLLREGAELLLRAKVKCELELSAGLRLVSALRDFSSLCSLFSLSLSLRALSLSQADTATTTQDRVPAFTYLLDFSLQQAICPVSFFEDVTVISVKSSFSFPEPPARLKPRSPHACECNGSV